MHQTTIPNSKFFIHINVGDIIVFNVTLNKVILKNIDVNWNKIFEGILNGLFNHLKFVNQSYIINNIFNNTIEVIYLFSVNVV